MEKMTMIESAKAMNRLWEIENATHIRLMQKQRKLVLSKERPVFDYTWGRASGKTITAIFWTLLWRKEPIILQIEQAKLVPQRRRLLKEKEPAIPDPDATNYPRLMNTILPYIKFCEMCTKARINVATVIMEKKDGQDKRDMDNVQE